MEERPTEPALGCGDELEAVRAELEAIEAKDLVPVNLDPTVCEMRVLGALPAVRQLRPEMVRMCGEVMASAVDRLELAARALGSAEARYLALGSVADVTPMSEAVLAARESLVCEARALIARKQLRKDALATLRGTNGYVSQISDVLLLATLFRGVWRSIEGKTGLTMADVDRAEAAADALVRALGERDQDKKRHGAIRDRAFTHLVRTYDQVRRMVVFVRWPLGDADRIAPSLYAGRRRKRGAPTEPPVTEVAAPTETESPAPAFDPPGFPNSNPFPNG